MKKKVRELLDSLEKELEKARKRGSLTQQKRRECHKGWLYKKKTGLPVRTYTFDKPRMHPLVPPNTTPR